MASMFALIACATLSAQSVIWKDDFDGDKGWQTFEYKGLYKAEYTKDGQFMLKSEGTKCISKCKTSLNPMRNFSILVEATSKSGLKEDSYFGLNRMNLYEEDNICVFLIFRCE